MPPARPRYSGRASNHTREPELKAATDMPRSTTRIIRRLAVFIVLFGALAGYGWWARPWEPRAQPVAVEIVTSGPAREVLAVNGQIVPDDEVVLGAPVSGQVREVIAKAGDEVAAGDVLARLDDTIARAALDQAEASLESARIEAQAARTSYDRATALAGTVSAQTRDSAQFTAQAADARVRQLTAALDQARRQLALYEITSPIDGTVLTTTAELGQMVGATSLLFTVGNLSAPLVETDVDEVYGARMTPGLAARVAPAGSREAMPATVTFVSPVVDPDTGGRTLRLSFETPPDRLLPRGLTMSVNIVVETFDAAITAPRAAILDLDGDPHVLLDVSGVAQKAPVEVRPWPAERLIVTDGLAAGDRLITNPRGVTPGGRVSADPDG